MSFDGTSAAATLGGGLGGGSSGDMDHRKKRRNRTTHSCINCHTTKRKCDRKRPCGRCTQLGLTGLCVYEVDDPTSADDPSVDEQGRLRKRIAELEGVIRELKNKPHPKWATTAASSTSTPGAGELAFHTRSSAGGAVATGSKRRRLNSEDGGDNDDTDELLFVKAEPTPFAMPADAFRLHSVDPSTHTPRAPVSCECLGHHSVLQSLATLEPTLRNAVAALSAVRHSPHDRCGLYVETSQLSQLVAASTRGGMSLPTIRQPSPPLASASRQTLSVAVPGGPASFSDSIGHGLPSSFSLRPPPPPPPHHPSHHGHGGHSHYHQHTNSYDNAGLITPPLSSTGSIHPPHAWDASTSHSACTSAGGAGTPSPMLAPRGAANTSPALSAVSRTSRSSSGAFSLGSGGAPGGGLPSLNMTSSNLFDGSQNVAAASSFYGAATTSSVPYDYSASGPAAPSGFELSSYPYAIRAGNGF